MKIDEIFDYVIENIDNFDLYTCYLLQCYHIWKDKNKNCVWIIQNNLGFLNIKLCKDLGKGFESKYCYKKATEILTAKTANITLSYEQREILKKSFMESHIKKMEKERQRVQNLNESMALDILNNNYQPEIKKTKRTWVEWWNSL